MEIIPMNELKKNLLYVKLVKKLKEEKPDYGYLYVDTIRVLLEVGLEIEFAFVYTSKSKTDLECN